MLSRQLLEDRVLNRGAILQMRGYDRTLLVEQECAGNRVDAIVFGNRIVPGFVTRMVGKHLWPRELLFVDKGRQLARSPRSTSLAARSNQQMYREGVADR